MREDSLTARPDGSVGTTIHDFEAEADPQTSMSYLPLKRRAQSPAMLARLLLRLHASHRDSKDPKKLHQWTRTAAPASMAAPTAADAVARAPSPDIKVFAADPQLNGGCHLQDTGSAASAALELHAHQSVRMLRTQHIRPLFLLFVGYPRSGHSLVGSLLDAHPQMVIAHEYNAFNKIAIPGMEPDTFLKGILSNAVACRPARFQAGYNFTVPGQWQGRWREPVKVVGDKRGGGTTRSILYSKNFSEAIAQLHHLEQLLAMRTKLLHVVRNPFDQIATEVLRSWWATTFPQRAYDGAVVKARFGPAAGKPLSCQDTDWSEYRPSHLRRLWMRAREFFQLAAVNHLLLLEDHLDTVVLHTEQFIISPQAELRRLCLVLGVTCTADYLEAAASVVDSGHTGTSHLVVWPAVLADRFPACIASFPWLASQYPSLPPLVDRRPAPPFTLLPSSDPGGTLAVPNPPWLYLENVDGTRRPRFNCSFIYDYFTTKTGKT